MCNNQIVQILSFTTLITKPIAKVSATKTPNTARRRAYPLTKLKSRVNINNNSDKNFDYYNNDLNAFIVNHNIAF